MIIKYTKYIILNMPNIKIICININGICHELLF